MAKKNHTDRAFLFRVATAVPRIVPPVALLAMLAACGDLKSDFQVAKGRAKTYVAAHPKLDDDTKDLILRNRIRVGMTKEQVLAAWGRPIEVNKFKREEEWKFGCEYPHTCTYRGRRLDMFDRVRYESQAIFENGRVTSFRY